LRDRDIALTNLAKFLGLFKEGKENAAPSFPLEIPPGSLTNAPVEAA